MYCFQQGGDSFVRTSDLTNFTYGKIQEQSTWRACVPLKDAHVIHFETTEILRSNASPGRNDKRNLGNALTTNGKHSCQIQPA